jgi:hypothetical protein
MRLFLTLRVLKRKGFRLLGGGTMKKVVMLFSLKLSQKYQKYRFNG